MAKFVILAALALLALVALVDAKKKRSTDEEIEALFNVWLEEHRLHFEGEAYQTRLAIFKKNLEKVKHNNEGEDSKEGLNIHAHITDAEFKKYRLGGVIPPQPQNQDDDDDNKKRALLAELEAVEESALPRSFDWRARGKVTSVKNQGSCGCCWAFASSGAIEGAWAIKKGKLNNLSPQHLLDCAKNLGCAKGGWTNEGYNLAQRTGIHTWKSYPYKGRRGTCRRFSTGIGARVSGQVMLPQGSQAALKAYVATKGPIAVLVDATYWSRYSSGVITRGRTSANGANHAVLLVGYGYKGSVPVWIIKNSWSTSWGYKGYALVKRGSANYCGVANWPNAPTI